MHPTKQFPATYAEGRSNFLSAAEVAGARLRSYQNPLRGPDGERLFTDAAWIGPAEARRVLITVSGTHGVEGFAGSGIQNSALRGGLYRALPDDVAVLLIHALTPFGFAWLRRTNEDGVDVARNFLDFTAPLPENRFYDSYAADLVPARWSGEEREHADARLFAFLNEHGLDALKAALARGQYSHWFAPFFGGHAPTWSNRALRAILREHAAAAREVFVVDYHTGLGGRATGQLISSEQPTTAAHQRAIECWGDKVVSVYASDTVAYEVTGDPLPVFQAELPRARVASAAYEFGTVAPFDVLQALRGDHWLHAHGDLHSTEAREIKSNVRDAFYCDSDDCRGSVFDLAATAEREALSALEGA